MSHDLFGDMACDAVIDRVPISDLDQLIESLLLLESHERCLINNEWCH